MMLTVDFRFWPLRGRCELSNESSDVGGERDLTRTSRERSDGSIPDVLLASSWAIKPFCVEQ
jgi:hypothetical protein